MAVAGGVDAGEARHAALGDHGALKLARTAVFEDEVCIEATDPLLVAVQFIGLNGGEAGAVKIPHSLRSGAHLETGCALPCSPSRNACSLRLTLIASRAHSGCCCVVISA